MAERKVDVDDLPQDVGQCHAMLMELFGELDVNARKLRHVQHVLEKMLRWRYGQRSERVGDENLDTYRTMHAKRFKHLAVCRT